jgi:hypothetical protein
MFYIQILYDAVSVNWLNKQYRIFHEHLIFVKAIKQFPGLQNSTVHCRAHKNLSLGPNPSLLIPLHIFAPYYQIHQRLHLHVVPFPGVLRPKIYIDFLFYLCVPHATPISLNLIIFLFTIACRPNLVSIQLPTQWVQGALSMGVKRPKREADHSTSIQCRV